MIARGVTRVPFNRTVGQYPHSGAKSRKKNICVLQAQELLQNSAALGIISEAVMPQNDAHNVMLQVLLGATRAIIAG